ncbi:hypothetical protein KC328_g69 [Hortaea werneckii]|nr:hypothetical protein KC328_g69 [Hortaea werneckii]
MYAFSTAIEIGQIAGLAIGADGERCAPVVRQICPVGRFHRVELAAKVHNIDESLQFQRGVNSHDQRGNKRDESKRPKRHDFEKTSRHSPKTKHLPI